VGFVEAGAAGVLASHWPVRDDATLLLSSKFYALWLDEKGAPRAGITPAQALRKATRWLRAVTFAELKTMFEPFRHDGKDYLNLAKDGVRLNRAAASVYTGGGGVGSGGSGENDGPDTSASDTPRESLPDHHLALPLGDDTDQPYAQTHLWAAFSLTGV